MYEIFESLLKARGITPYRVYKETGVSQSTLSDWKRGRSTPKTEILKKIADYFGVSLDYLTSGEEQTEKTPAKAEAEEDPLSQVSFALFGTHDVLDEELLDDVRAYARFKLEQQRKAAEGKK